MSQASIKEDSACHLLVITSFNYSCCESGLMVVCMSNQIPANKSFFKALFRHTQNLCRWGCIATGLECCKLLLSLDDADPMGAIFFIDYMAIRAGNIRFTLMELVQCL